MWGTTFTSRAPIIAGMRSKWIDGNSGLAPPAALSPERIRGLLPSLSPPFLENACRGIPSR